MSVSGRSSADSGSVADIAGVVEGPTGALPSKMVYSLVGPSNIDMADRSPVVLHPAFHVRGRRSDRRSRSMGATPMRPFKVARDGDRHAVHRDIGIGTLSVKVTTADSNGAFLVAEIAHHAKGGPPRHLHRDQDEWFHVIEGEYI